VELNGKEGVVLGLQSRHKQIATLALGNRGDSPEIQHVSVIGKGGQLESILVVEVQNALLGQFVPEILTEVIVEG
jgi:hypothetical protein